jgi:hypothetical protein
MRTDTLGAGEPILGMSTTRVRTAGSRTLSQSLGSMACTREVQVEMIAWRVSDATLSRVQVEMARGMAASLGNASPLTEMLQAQSTSPTEASVVRSTITNRSRGRDGVPVSVTTTVDVTEFRLGDVDAALFAVPDGFQIQDITSMMQGTATESRMQAIRERMFWVQHDSTQVLPNGAKACVRTASPH